MSEPVSKVSFFRPIGGARPVVSREAVLHAAYAVLTGTAYTDFTFARVAQVAGADESELHRWWDTPGELAVDTFFALLDLQDSECAQTDFRIQTHGLASQLRGPMGKAFTQLLAQGRTSPPVAVAVRKRWLDPRRNWARDRMARAAEDDQLRVGVDTRAALALIYSPIYSPLLFGNDLPPEDDLARCFDLAARTIFRR